MTPSTILRARSTSPPKSAWPGVSTMLILVSLIEDGGVLGEDGDAALALELVRVHDALGDGLIGAEGAGLAEHGVDEGGLAVVDVGDDGDVADDAHRNFLISFYLCFSGAARIVRSGRQPIFTGIGLGRWPRNYRPDLCAGVETVASLSVYQPRLNYSYLSDSTGSIWAARLAGRVPKTMPTAAEVNSAITTDQAETGTV